MGRPLLNGQTGGELHPVSLRLVVTIHWWVGFPWDSTLVLQVWEVAL